MILFIGILYSLALFFTGVTILTSIEEIVTRKFNFIAVIIPMVTACICWGLLLIAELHNL